MRRIIPVLPALRPTRTVKNTTLHRYLNQHPDSTPSPLNTMYTRWPATRPWLFFPLIENRGFLCIPRPSALAELQATLDAFISTSTKIPATDVPIDPYQWSKTATLECAVTTSRCGLQDTFNRAVSARYTILSEVFLRWQSVGVLQEIGRSSCVLLVCY